MVMLVQGAIDASRLFGTAFGHTLLKRVGARRTLWDREVWEYHKGPLSATAASLESILAACNDIPPTTGAPPGWAVFSKHTDDGLGTANAQPTLDYLLNAIGIDWAIRGSGWTTHLGYGLGLSSCGCFCSIDCMPVIEALYQRHMGAHNTYKPKHPYPMDIDELKPGVRPPIDSPERAVFDEMQAKCQNGLATSIWISRAHTLHVYPTNFLFGIYHMLDSRVPESPPGATSTEGFQAVGWGTGTHAPCHEDMPREAVCDTDPFFVTNAPRRVVWMSLRVPDGSHRQHDHTIPVGNA